MLSRRQCFCSPGIGVRFQRLTEHSMKIYPHVLCCFLTILLLSGCKKSSSTQEDSSSKSAASTSAAPAPTVPAANVPAAAPGSAGAGAETTAKMAATDWALKQDE